jgi:hypothetical protein
MKIAGRECQPTRQIAGKAPKPKGNGRQDIFAGQTPMNEKRRRAAGQAAMPKNTKACIPFASDTFLRARQP